MAKARVEVVGGRRPRRRRARSCCAANPGSPPLPLAKVASGRRAGPGHAGPAPGALRGARRRSCSTRSTPASAAPPPRPSAGRSPRSGDDHQVLVVTHLAQVAAFADAQVVVRKDEADGRRPRPRPSPLDAAEPGRRAGPHAVGLARTATTARQPRRGAARPRPATLADRTLMRACPHRASRHACTAGPSPARATVRFRRDTGGRRRTRSDQAHLRDRRCGQLPRQGAHGLLARSAAEGPGPAGHDAEARPVHQRRSGHDEPVRARRGVRHRRRRRDRPRPRPLRALHRRAAHPGLQRHDRLDLLGGARRRAPGRLPGQDRAGHPAHHRRDQAAHHPPGRRRRRRGHHRGRRHRRRHRDPPVPRGHPAVPPRRRPRQRLLRPRHAGAVHRPVRRAEDQADPALGHRAAQPGHPARRHRVPQRGADLGRPQAQDLQPVRRARRARSSTPPTPATSTRSRSCCTRRASTRWCASILGLDRARPRPVRVGDPRSTGSRPPTTRCASASSAST